MKVVEKMENTYNHGEKNMETTLSWHYFILSKYFNIYNYYDYKDVINEFDNAVIYHLPFGKDNIDSGIEEELLLYKGKIPIVMRSYDAHSPLKTSVRYMEKYHDLILTYLKKHVNNKNILFANISYDNHLVYQYNSVEYRRKLACMVLRKEIRKEYYESSDKFKEKNLDLEKIYDLREKIIDFKQIDIYGQNWPYSRSNYKGSLYPHMKKYAVLNEYKFNIIIENVIVDNFLSEKILDSFISLSIPVYLGSPKVEEWIPKSCYVDIRDFKSNSELVDYLENISDDEYNSYIDCIRIHRTELFNTFSSKKNFAEPLYKWYKDNYNKTLDYNNNDFTDIEQKIINLRFKDSLTLSAMSKQIWMKIKLFYYKLLVKD